MSGGNVMDDRQDRFTDRLSEYLDGDLDSAERDEMERHLRACGRCSTTISELRRIATHAPALQRTVDPPRDLWSGIQARLTTRPNSEASAAARRVVAMPAHHAAHGKTILNRWSVRGLAFAATFVIACAVVVLLMLRDRPVEPVQHRAGPVAMPPVVDPAYDDRIAELRRTLASRLTADPHVLTVLDTNLAALETAIIRYEEALFEHPSEEYLRRRLQQTRRQKLELLEQAAAVTSEAGN